MSEVMWIAVIGWALSMGVQVGMFWSLRAKVDELEGRILHSFRTREEGDEIVKRIEFQINETLRRVEILEKTRET